MTEALFPRWRLPVVMAHPDVRARNDARRPVAVLSADLSRYVYANEPAARLIGITDVQTLDIPAGAAAVTLRQFAASRSVLSAMGQARARLRPPGGLGPALSADIELIEIEGWHLALVSFEDEPRAPENEDAAELLNRLLAESGPGSRLGLFRDGTAETDDLQLAKTMSGFLEGEERVREIDTEAGPAILARVAPDCVILSRPSPQDAPPFTSDVSDEDETPKPSADQTGSSGERVGVTHEPVELAEDGRKDEPPTSAESGRDAAIRFVWRIDADGRFRSISPDFALAVGPRSADVIGHRFVDVAQAYGLDPEGETTRLLEERHTWSGRSVAWPQEGTDQRVPVDLAALPVFARDRTFDGFRGFGVARLADAFEAPEVGRMPLGAAAFRQGSHAVEEHGEVVANEEDLPLDNEPPLPSRPFGRRAPEDRPATPPARIIKLDERRPSRDLNQDEVAAFYAIGETLGDGDSPLERAVREASRRINDMDDPETPADMTLPPPNAPEGSGPDGTRAPRRPKDGAVATLASLDPSGNDGSGSGSSPGETAPPSERGSSAGEAAEVTKEVAGDLFEAPDRPADRRNPPPPAPAGPRAEVSLPEPERLAHALEGVYRSLPLAILVLSEDRPVYHNAEFGRLSGYDGPAAVEDGGGIDSLLPAWANEDGFDEAEGRTLLRRADGETIEVSVELHPVRIAGTGCCVLTLRELIERGEADQARKEEDLPAASDFSQSIARERLVAEAFSSLETATDGLLVIGGTGAVEWASPSAARLFGRSGDVLTGGTLTSLFARESHDRIRSSLTLAAAGRLSELEECEVIGLGVDGRFLPLALRLAPLPEGRSCIALRDISRRKRAEQELIRAQQEAEAHSLQKSQFLTNISHEMRTPLNAILGFADVMAAECFGPIGDARYLEYLDDMKRSGQHVLELVNDLLDISKIESGRLDLHFEAVSLNEVVGEIVQMMQPQANSSRVIVRSNLPSSVPPVVADRRSIRQIALNLIGNAIRFTPEGGQLVVSTISASGGEVSLRFRDNGIGMNEDEVAIAMTPFRQVNADHGERGKGTGLGLPLTKAIAEANGAIFSITSAPGEGTLVEVTFPAPRVLID